MRTLIRLALLFTAVMAIAAASRHAQSQTASDVAFEVASIRLHTPDANDDGGGGGPRPGGRYVYTNVPVRTLLSIAFEMPAQRILNLPGWVTRERYDIQAIGKDKPSAGELARMLRRLLTERFNLAAHIERRDLPVYRLVRPRPDSSFGPGLRPTTIDCFDPAGRTIAAENARATGRPTCAIRVTPESYASASVRIADLLPEIGRAH